MTARSGQPAVPCPGAEHALGLGRYLPRGLGGVVYVALVIKVYARYIVGRGLSRTAQAGFVFDALEQPIYDRRPIHRGGFVHHSDRGRQYLSIKYTERFAEAGIELSLGRVMTMPCPRPSTVSAGPRSSTSKGRGDRSRPSKTPRSNRSTRSVPADVGANLQYPARRSRTTILRYAGRTTHGSITQTNGSSAIG